ncbi:MAG: response regulator [Actinomycetota bacterium]
MSDSPVNPWSRSRGKKVLVVDDDPDMRMLVAVLLGNKGFTVVGQSSDGADAVRVSYEEQPDFVVLDHMMPNVDGRDAASFIRATCPRAYILAFSGAGITHCDWADDLLDKNDITKLPILLERVVSKRNKMLPA